MWGIVLKELPVAFGSNWGPMHMSGVSKIALLCGASIVIGVAAPAAGAKDRPPPLPPCPLTAQLRVADAASLTSMLSLSQCGSAITIAPATPDEIRARDDVEIRPEPPRHQRARLELAGGAAHPDKIEAGQGPMKVAAIAPKTDEQGPGYAGGVSLASAGSHEVDAILAMRPMSYTTQHDAMITRVAARHRIDPLFLHAVIAQESQYKASATSPAGARGLMQLMPGTARELDVRGAAITHPEANVDGGARLLRRLHNRYGDFTLTLAAYNAGEGAVAKYGNRVPPYRETQDYVRKVMERYERLVAEQGGGGR